MYVPKDNRGQRHGSSHPPTHSNKGVTCARACKGTHILTCSVSPSHSLHTFFLPLTSGLLAVPVWCVRTQERDPVFGLGRLKQLTLCECDQLKILSLAVLHCMDKPRIITKNYYYWSVESCPQKLTLPPLPGLQIFRFNYF